MTDLESNVIIGTNININLLKLLKEMELDKFMAKNKAFIGVVLGVIVLSLAFQSSEVTGQQSISPMLKSCKFYDRFNSQTLNTNKWSESPDFQSGGMMDEHFINTSKRVYHTAQISPSDKGVKLEMIRHNFTVGDSVSVDLNYISGSGNRMNRIFLNGNALDLTVSYGLIGYWGQNGTISNQLGKYKVKAFFDAPNSTRIKIKRPDGSYWSHTVTNLNYPVNFGIGTRTGGNGMIHMDYDDVILCR